MKERVLTGRKFLLSLSALLALVFLVAFFSPAAAASRQIALIPAGGKVLLLEEWGGDCLFAYSGGSTGAGAVVVLDKATGEPKGSVSLSLFWAGLRDGSLFVAEDSNGEALLTQLSLPSLTTVSSRPLPAAADSFLLFDCNGQGRFYYSQDGNFLYTATSDQDIQPLARQDWLFPTFLEITPGGTFFAATNSLYFWGSSETPAADTWSKQAAAEAPLSLLGETCFVTVSGKIYQYQTGADSLTLAGALPVPVSDPLLCSLDQKGNLVYASSSQTLACATLAGTEVGALSLRGELLAVCGSGAITQEDGAYWFTPLSFYEAPATPTPEPIPTDTPSPQPTLPPGESSPEPEATPTPEPDPTDTPSPQPTLPPEESSPEPEATPTPEPDPTDTPSPQPTLPPEESSPEPEATPTPEPDPTDTPSPKPDSFTREGDMLVAKPGTTVEDLIAYLKPGTAHIRWPDGTDVVSGRLATGMTAGDYTIAVLGDCSGNGSLSAADLEEAQGLLLEGSQVEGPWRRAADLDGDGRITTLDLVLLSQALEP